MLAVLMNMGFAGGGEAVTVTRDKFIGFIANVGRLMNRG